MKKQPVKVIFRQNIKIRSQSQEIGKLCGFERDDVMGEAGWELSGNIVGTMCAKGGYRHWGSSSRNDQLNTWVIVGVCEGIIELWGKTPLRWARKLLLLSSTRGKEKKWKRKQRECR